jgi:ipoprotein LpqH
VKASVCTVAAALLIAGCSTGNAATPPRGALPPGTAVLRVDGKDIGTTYSVRCESIDWMTRIHTTGLNAMLSRAETLTTDFVRLEDVDGFTGSFERGLQGEATIAMTGPTYQITGAALGFNKSEPTRLKAETFALRVSC